MWKLVLVQLPQPRAAVPERAGFVAAVPGAAALFLPPEHPPIWKQRLQARFQQAPHAQGSQAPLAKHCL